MRMSQAQYEALLIRGRRYFPGKGHRVGEDAVDDESKLQSDIRAECQRRGWYCVSARMDRKTTTAIGTPDFIVAMPDGRTLWIEAKTRTGKLTPAQMAAAAWLKKLGHEYHIVRSAAEFAGMATDERKTR